MLRPPISLERVQWGGEGVVHDRAKGGPDGRTLPPGNAAGGFDPAELTARVIMHIPEPRRHLVPYYGWYSNVTEHDVIDAILRHLAKTEARSPRGPPGAATLPATS